MRRALASFFSAIIKSLGAEMFHCWYPSRMGALGRLLPSSFRHGSRFPFRPRGGP